MHGYGLTGTLLMLSYPAMAQAVAPQKPADSSSAEVANSRPAPTVPKPHAVDSEFATYDVDHDGVLNKAEFGAWMASLRKAAEPGFDAGTADTQAWIGRAFEAADADHSDSIDKAELIRFLTPRQGG